MFLVAYFCFGAGEEACLKGDVSVCEDLAFEAEKAMDIKKAVKFYKKACDFGNVVGCESYVMLGGLSIDNKGFKGYSVKDFENYEKECHKGKENACYFAAFALHYDILAGIKQDFSKAVDLYGTACDAKNAMACTHLGMLYLNGDGAVQDDKIALDNFVKACEISQNNNGDFDKMFFVSCRFAGQMYEKKKDIKSAIKYYKIGTEVHEVDNINYEAYCRLNGKTDKQTCSD